MKTGAARALVADSQDLTPESFIEEIQSIFNSGTLRGAREVAERGLALYPDYPELRRLHHALRPFEVRVSHDPHLRVPDRKETFEWLQRNWDHYRGQWVAVLGTDLIAASPDFEQVLEAVRSRDLPAIPLLHFFD
ncbi:MAG: DUF5678 domain-containing protein [Thermoanaerobaculia bacterium]